MDEEGGFRFGLSIDYFPYDQAEGLPTSDEFDFFDYFKVTAVMESYDEGEREKSVFTEIPFNKCTLE